MSLSQHPVQPRSTAGTMPLAPFVILGAAWAAIVVAWLAWAAGGITAALTGRAAGPGFGSSFVIALARGRFGEVFPDVNHAAVGVVFAVLLAATVVPVLAGVVVWQRRRTHAADPLPSLAGPRDVADLTPAGVTKRARQLRPSLANVPAKQLRPADTGLALGTMVLAGRDGPLLRASWEDVIVALMGPRAMKTTALAVPLILDAPGAVLATSNRADVWATTHAARAKVGRVWVFDPQNITRVGRHWWWNPLSSILSVEDATRLAGHFIQPIRRDKGEDFWLMAAEDLLATFFLAAAASGATMTDVQAWLAEASDDEPARLLDACGYRQSARALRGRQNGAPETRDGIYETARTAAKCLQDPRIMAWVNPPTIALPAFDPDAFPVSTDTLYLLSKDGAGSSGPLVAGLTDQVMRHGVRRAEAAGGRLDPPMLPILDEAANICPIADLPQLYSHYGGRGICLVTILQNFAQGTLVWGERGMSTLWSAATVKLIGAGIDDPRFASDVSTLVGEHDVATLTLSRDSSGHLSRQVSLRRQRILGPEDIRALKRGTALLLASGARPAMLRLHPWFRQPRAAELSAATAAAVGQISGAAERERLLADLAADGASLPSTSRGPALTSTEPDSGDGSDGGGVHGEVAKPPAAGPATASPAPRFHGPTPGRRP